MWPLLILSPFLGTPETTKVAFAVSEPGGGCTGCVGVNIAWTPRWFKESANFWSRPPPPPPFQGAKMFKGCRGQGLHLGSRQ